MIYVGELNVVARSDGAYPILAGADLDMRGTEQPGGNAVSLAEKQDYQLFISGSLKCQSHRGKSLLSHRPVGVSPSR
jgi:hypothetical protein